MKRVTWEPHGSGTLVIVRRSKGRMGYYLPDPHPSRTEIARAVRACRVALFT